MQVAFTHMNEGGMMTRFLGLRLFMPLSHVHKPEPRTFLDQQVDCLRAACAHCSCLHPGLAVMWSSRVPAFSQTCCLTVT